MADYQPVSEADLEPAQGGTVATAAAPAPQAAAPGGYQPVNDNDLAPPSPTMPTDFRGFRGGIPTSAAARIGSGDAFTRIFKAAASNAAQGFVNSYSALADKDQQDLAAAGYKPGDFKSVGGALRYGADVFAGGLDALQDGFLSIGPAITQGLGGGAEQAAREAGAGKEPGGEAEQFGRGVANIGEAGLADVGDMHAVSMVDAAKAQATAPGIYSQAWRMDATPGGGIVQTPLGRLPSEAEAAGQAQTVATALHLPDSTAPLIQKIYTDTGRPPAEVLMDAKTNAGGVLSDLVQGKVPEAYVPDWPKPTGPSSAIPKNATETQPGIAVYHGSPAAFEKFDLSKIGEGEGSAAFGRGGYFSENPQVAQSYQDVGGTPGNLYRARINASGDEFLDWDKAIKNQPPAIRDFILDNKLAGPDATGEDLVRGLDPKDLKQMENAGIKGIRYLDENSRWMGEGTSNFVVFNPEHDVDILDRNGEAIEPKGESRGTSEPAQPAGPPKAPVVGEQEGAAQPQAAARIPPAPGTPIEPYVPGVSKIGRSIEQKAIDQGVTDGFLSTAGYDVKTVKGQTAMVSDLVANSPDKMNAIINGEESLPHGMDPAMFIAGVETYIEQTKDWDLAARLANSPVVTKTSEAAQTLRFAQERVPDNATAKLREIQAANETAAGGAEKVVQKVTQAKAALKEGVAGVFLPKEEMSWEKFLGEIAC